MLEMRKGWIERQREPLCIAGPEVSISKQGPINGHTYSPSAAADFNLAVGRTVLRVARRTVGYRESLHTVPLFHPLTLICYFSSSRLS